jgi:hypothetical protein
VSAPRYWDGFTVILVGTLFLLIGGLIYVGSQAVLGACR